MIKLLVMTQISKLEMHAKKCMLPSSKNYRNVNIA